MIRGLWTAATGMSAQQSNVAVIANNLANVNTSGFKRSRTNFQDLMYQNIRNAGVSTSEGSQLPVGIQVGMGTKVISVSKNFQQGTTPIPTTRWTWPLTAAVFQADQ